MGRVEGNLERMLTLFVRPWRWLGVAAPLLCAGCSFTLNWDVDALACQGATQACGGGYSCLDGKCIKNGERGLNQSCARDVQCSGNNKCPTNVCAPPCALQTAYSASSCAAGRYCAPFLTYSADLDDGSVNKPPDWVAVCLPSDTCTPGNACAGAEASVCTALDSSLNACLPACSVQLSAGLYTNTCTPNYYPRYCTPVGKTGNQQLVCLNVGSAPLPTGQPCSSAAAPCTAQDACIGGSCRTYCQINVTNANSGCGGSQQCCPLQVNATVLVGYCADACT